MRMQTEVPSSLESHKGRFATNPTRTFLADALKADRNHRITFCGPRGSYEIVRAISFNAGTHKCGEQNNFVVLAKARPKLAE